jgi:hypothetical protein
LREVICPALLHSVSRFHAAQFYDWRKDDREFDSDWKDAAETSLDEIETKLQRSAMAGNSQNAYFILRYRRYNRPEHKQRSNFIMNVTLEEHTERLERLGLPVPVIKSDLEEDDELWPAPGSTDTELDVLIE